MVTNLLVTSRLVLNNNVDMVKVVILGLLANIQNGKNRYFKLPFLK